MRTQHRVFGRRALGELQFGDGAVRVYGQAGGDRVDAGFLQPLGAPGLEIAAGGLLQFAQQVGQGGVGVGVAVQVVVDTFEELRAAHVECQLLQHGGALGVGDAVEVDVGVVEVVDRGDDWVRGGQLILAQRPALLTGAEGGPGVVPFGGFSSGQRGGEFGEGLVEPQVVPPLHGHVVAEPHVGQLVQHGHHAALGQRVGHLGFEHVGVADGDHADVLHGARVVFGNVDLVELGVRVGHAPGLGVEREALLGDVEQVVDVLREGLGQRLSAVLGHRHGATVFVQVFGVPFGVRAGADGGQVGAHHRGRLEVPQTGAFVRLVAEGAVEGFARIVLDGGNRHVGGDDPAGGSEHLEIEGGLQVRLVEHGVDAARVRHLELGVQVDVAIGRVDRAVQALAGVGVTALGFDGDLVLLLEVGQFDAVVLEGHGWVQGLAVEVDGCHFVGNQVEEGRRTRLRVEADERLGTEVLRADRQVKVDVIVNRRFDNGLTFFGFNTSEIRTGHDFNYSLRSSLDNPDYLVSTVSTSWAMSATTGTIIGLRCSWRATQLPSVRRMVCCSL